MFLLLPKAANTSIKLAIHKAYGLPTHDLHRGGYLEYVGTKEARRFPLRIAIVRDPVARFASFYRDKIAGAGDEDFLKGLRRFGLKPGMLFREAVENVALLPDRACTGAGQHFRSMSWSLIDADGLVPNEIGRFESLRDGWKRIQQIVRAAGGPDLPALTHERKGAGDVAIDKRSRAFLVQRYRDDIRNFNYP
ncbi:MAG TPA: sulfotransferase family 2 domain-containing protein [Alphaproteobacteria bacterium]|nr:sulfotransferase family 2 domain-containing protein [Alphaproteobacteria bacterium]